MIRLALLALGAAGVAGAMLLDARAAASAGPWTAQAAGGALPFSFTNVAERAGLAAITVFGGRERNRYLLETTGCGAAFLDYDNDGRLDASLVNGTTLEGFQRDRSPRATSTAIAATERSRT